MLRSHMKTFIAIVAGPLVGSLAFLLLQHLGTTQACMAGTVAWMAVWWITEAVPIPITSLLPIVLFPLFGIAELGATTAYYGKDVIFLFLGGFLLALGIERSGLHRRLALMIVARVGASPSRLVLGTLLATGFLSMWINSTAAVLVMLPIALSLESHAHGHQRFGLALSLAVAYGATIGGMATPVGTPPNLVFMSLWKQQFPELPPIGFGQWMLFGVPYASLFLLFTWLLLTRVLYPMEGTTHVDRKALREQLAALGRASRDELLAALVFTLTALLWITGDDIQISSSFTLHGWRSALGLKGLGDPAVAIVGGLFLFLIPSGTTEDKGDRRMLLDWEFAQGRIPWGVVLLIGSGFAIAGGIDASGLSATIGKALAGMYTGSQVLQVAAVGSGVTLLSELGSNTAVASLVLPIMASTATGWGMSPQSLMIPATIAASCGFMLPIASPMQAVVFTSGRMSVKQMMRAGVWMDAVGVVLLVLLWWLLGTLVFG